MNKNIGKVDKVIRIVVGVAIIAFGLVNNSWLGLIGLIPLGTALIGWCPLYCPLKINTTCDKENCEKK
ncbi:YgaP family membrane protein [Arcobacter sp.]|uniref:YgaP family membrane protein n=2 Tax=Arcobacter sp. TaxID=1872629 RepID=UPI003D0F34AA